MPDQTSNVSGGLSLLLKTAKPGRAEPTIGSDTTNRNVTSFSKDLEQAQQQQQQQRAFDEANRNAVVAIDTQRKLPVTATLSEKGSGFQTSKTEEQAAASVAGRLAPTEVDVPANVQRVSDAAPDKMALTPIAGALNGTMEKVVTPDTLAGRSRPLANGLDEHGLAQDSPIEEQAAASVAGRLAPTEVDVPANVQRVSDAAPDKMALTPIAGALNGTMEKVVTPDTLAGRSRPLANGLDEHGLAQDSPIEEPAAASVAGRLVPTEVDVPANVQRVSDAAPDKTALTPIAGALNGTMEKVVTPDTLAGRSSQLANGLEKNTGMANTADLSSGILRLSGEGANAAMTGPETLPSDQAVKSVLSQANAMGSTQVTSGTGIVTQATLAGRLRQPSYELIAKGTEVLPKPGDFGLLQTGTAPLSARGLESLSASGTPMRNDSESGIDSLMGFTDGNKTVQQRIATTEAMLAQMAGETVNAVVKSSTADNTLLAMSGGTVAAPAVQHTSSVTGPIIQAPLNIPLTTANAETALAGNVKWMTNEGVKNAVMTVTPHGMGPISIKIGIDGNQMDVSIIASQHTTRDALESMLPRLREQLAVQGHESVKVDVSDGKSEQSRSGSGQAFAESRNPGGATPQDNQSNSSKNGEKTENGGSEKLEVVSESFMAEDLQRVAARVAGEVDGRPVFDAYV